MFGRGDVQRLEYTQSAKTGVETQHGKESSEEDHRPFNFCKDQYDHLEYDQEPINNCPKDTSWLVRYC